MASTSFPPPFVARTAMLLATAVAIVGCSRRELRPLNPCTRAGASLRVDVRPTQNVDLLFVVDDSGSMRQEQAKLRAQFRTMVHELLTGDPPVRSLRVAVITSDMGVAGVGTTPETMATRIPSCGLSAGGFDAERARFGNDGVFRRTTRSFVSSGATVLDCDTDDDGADDVLPVGSLPTHLTFEGPTMGAPDDAEVDEFVRRVSCSAHVGTGGCAFEQPLEAMLKALTPADESPGLEGGPFFAPSDAPTRSFGHLDDPATNGGWLREDSLLAVVYVSDEDDCSSTDPRVFDYGTTDPSYADPYGPHQVQTRCARFEDELVLPAERYVQGLLARRRDRPNSVVFAAITGVPADLTDGVGAGPGVAEGTDNLEEVLLDERMQYVFRSQIVSTGSGSMLVPDAQMRAGCVHTVPEERFDASAALTAGSTAVNGLVVLGVPSRASFVATGDVTVGTTVVQNVVLTFGSPELVPGLTVSGAGIPDGAVITSITGDPATTGPFTVRLSAPATATTVDGALTIGAGFGPAPGQLAAGPGLEVDTTVVAVTGTGPYDITLSSPPSASVANATLTLGTLDVQASPARRAVRVARGLDLEGASVVVQSICVDDFAPAMRRILEQIQANLDGTCLDRSMNRNANDEVDCDVFVRLPPNVGCASTPGMVSLHSVVATDHPDDGDGWLERCVMDQVPVDGTQVVGDGWYYDDFSSDATRCRRGRRISFTIGAVPPEGSSVQIGCAQRVRDGTLAVDLELGCEVDGDCSFPTQEEEARFVDRYNLAVRGYVMGVDGLICEDRRKTCQIPCASDADCPGGFVCHDDPASVVRAYCVNPTCGAD